MRGGAKRLSKDGGGADAEEDEATREPNREQGDDDKEGSTGEGLDRRQENGEGPPEGGDTGEREDGAIIPLH